MDYTIVEYAEKNIWCKLNASPSITNSIIRYGTYGVYCEHSSGMIISTNTISNNEYPIFIPGNIDFCNNTFANNTNNIIELLGDWAAGQIKTDTTWKDIGLDIVVSGYIQIRATGLNATATLTIEPGVKIRFNESAHLRVGYGSGNGYGALRVNGTVDKPVTFTSNQPEPKTKGYWNGLQFYSATADSETVINHAIIEYGDDNIYCYYASPVIQNSIIRNSSGYGIRCTNYSSPQIVGNVISNNNRYGIYCSSSSSPIIATNTFTNNNSYPICIGANSVRKVTNNTYSGNSPNAIYVLGETIGTTGNWTNQGASYVIGGNVYVKGSPTVTLTIEPNVEVRFAQNTFLYIGGSGVSDKGKLIADGTAGTITFTSNQATHTAGWWGCIYFDTYSDDTGLLKNVVVEYGGYSNNANIYCNNASPAIRDSVIRKSSGYGLFLQTSSSLTNCIIEDNNSHGIYCSNNTAGIITNNTIIKNRDSGIYCCQNSSPKITNNIIGSSTRYGICEYDATSDPATNYNCFFSNTTGNYFDKDTNGTKTVEWLNTTAGYTGNIDANPQFVDFDAKDYHLGTSSPCIDVGTNTAPDIPQTDKDGNLRIGNNIVDIGAYEFYAAAPPVLPSVTNVTLDKTSPIGVGTVTVTVTFNKTMDTTATPTVTSGLTFPYETYTVSLNPLWLNGGTQYQASFVINQTYQSGIYIISIKDAKDTIGNAISRDTSCSFDIDVTLPTAQITLTPASPVKAGTATVRLTASEVLGVVPELNFTPDGGTLTSVMLAGTGTTYNGTITITAAMPNGTVTFNFIGTDTAGNVGQQITQGAVFIIDTIAPLPPVLDSPAPSKTTAIIVYGTSEANSLVEVFVGTVSQGSVWSNYYTGRFAIWATLLDGTNSITAKATDKAGNIGELSAEVTAILDRISPAVSSITPPNGSTTNNLGAVRAILSDSGYAGLNLDSSGIELWFGASGVIGSKTINGTDTVIFTPNPALAVDGSADGTYTIKVFPRDLAGNAGSTTIAAIRYRTIPVMPMVSLEAVPGLINTRTVTFTGTASITEGNIAAVEYRLDTSAVWVSATATDGGFDSQEERYEFTVGSLTDGAHTVTVRAVNEKGNKTAPADYAVASFTIDVTPPTAQITITPISPVKTGTVAVRLTTSEVFSGIPGLTFTPDSGTPTVVVLAGTGPTYNATITITADMPNGTAGFYFTGTDTAGNVGHQITQGQSFIIDTVAPESLKAFSVIGAPNGGVKLTWEMPQDTSVRKFKVYRGGTSTSLSYLISVYNNNITYDYPPANTVYYYCVMAIDDAGNEGSATSAVSIFTDNIPPTARITLDKTLPVEAGLLLITLNVSEELVESPTVIYKPANKAGISVSLTGEGKIWQGYALITGSTGDGLAQFSFSGKDKSGNTGSIITQGATFTINASLPSAEIKLSPASPVGIGTMGITLIASEPLSGTPSLRFRIGTDTGVEITNLSSSDNITWQGSTCISPTMSTGWGTFTYKGIDKFDGIGTAIISGQTFFIDTTPLVPPVNLAGTSTAGGRISLFWQAGEDELPTAYNVYRGTATITTTGLPVYKNIRYTQLVDIPPADGEYYYAVTSIDNAGNQSRLSDNFRITSDRTPPPAPATLTAVADAKGLVSLNWSESESGAVYSLYRSSSTITTTARLSPVITTGSITATDMPPDQGSFYYAVVAADKYGNTGNVSNSVRVAVDVIPPTAAIVISPASPVSVGSLTITLVLSEVLAGTPSLTLITPDEAMYTINLAKQGTVIWSGIFVIAAITSSGVARFEYNGVDLADNTGTTISKGEQFIIDLIPPAQVTQFSGSSSPDGRIYLRWLPVTSEPVTYRVLRGTATIVLADKLAQTFYEDLPPEDGTYCYRVLAMDNVGNKGVEALAVFAVSDRTPPATPAITGIQKETAAVTVQWTQGESDAAYWLYRAANTTTGMIRIATTTAISYTDRLSTDGHYYYQVRAVDNAGNQSPASAVSSILWDTTPPTAEIILPRDVIGAGKTQIILKASEGLSATPTVTFWVVDGSRGTVSLDSGTSTTLWAGTLELGTQTSNGAAFFRFEGRDAAGNQGTRITRGEAFFIDTIPPSAPGTPSINIAANGIIALMWSRPVTGEIPALYGIYRGATATNLVQVATVATTLYNDRTPSEGWYYYVVASIDNAGNTSPYSVMVSVCSDNTPPATPTISSVTREGTQIRVCWNDVEGAANYRIYRSRTAFSEVAMLIPVKTLSAATSTTDLPPDGNWYYGVTSLDFIGNESLPSSNISINWDASPPQGIINQTVDGLPVLTPLRAGRVMNITLGAAEEIVGTPSLGVILPSGTTTELALEQAGQNQWLATLIITANLGDGVATFTFTGTDTAGNVGTGIASGKTFVIDTTLPGAPYTLMAKPTPDGGVRLKWGPPRNEPAKTYNIYCSTSTISAITVLNIHSLTPLIADYQNMVYEEITPVDGEYWYAVVAIDLAGNVGTGTDYTVASVRTDRLKPAAPATLTLTLSEKQIILGWTGVDDAVSYNLYRSSATITDISGLTPRYVGITNLWAVDIPAGTDVFYYAVTAVDVAGNESSISNNASSTFDFTNPTCKIFIEPKSPVKAGDVRVTLIASEPLSCLPVLLFVSAGIKKVTVPIALSGTGTTYQGTLTVTNTIPDGNGYFDFSGTDTFGNPGYNILAGESLVIDQNLTDPLQVVSTMKVKSQPEGYLELEWQHPRGEPFVYHIYRNTSEITNIVGVERIRTQPAKDTPAYRDLPPSDGRYFYAIIAEDEAGNATEFVESIMGISDRTPPQAPVELEAQLSEDGRVKLSWKPPSGESTPNYKIYRNGRVIAPVGYKNVYRTFYNDTLPANGTFSYQVSALDAVSNEGEKSTVAEVCLPVDLTLPPHAKITTEPPSPVNQGFRITLHSLTPLVKPPYLTCHAEKYRESNEYNWENNGREFIIGLTGSGTTWEGSFEVNYKIGEGILTFDYIGTDYNGKTSNLILEGKEVYVDRTPPTARVDISPVSPVDSGTLTITMTTSEFVEPVDTHPLLTFTPIGGIPIPIVLTGTNGTRWTSSILITNEIKDGRANFAFLAKDRVGNIGTNISYGGLFDIDQTPPQKPFGLTGSSTSGGRIVLGWYPPLDDVVKSFNLYRSRVNIITRTGLTPVMTNIYSRVITDIPSTDGPWYYAVTCVDSLAREGEVATNTCVVSDRLAPGAPANLQGTQTEGNAKITWNEPAGELPSVYRIYRQGVTFRGISGKTPLMSGTATEFVDHLGGANGTYYYGVTSVDSLGNESPPSVVPLHYYYESPKAGIILSRGSLTITSALPVLTPGDVTVTLISTGTLSQTSLWYQPRGMEPVLINLVSTNNIIWSGEMHITKSTGDGRAKFIFEGKDAASGNIGQVITRGQEFMIDTVGPTAKIEVSPVSPYRISTRGSTEADVTQSIESPEVVKAGTLTVTITTSEPLSATPTLTLTPYSRTPISIPLTGSGTKWQGEFKASPYTGNGVAIFDYTGVDTAGIKETIIDSGRAIKIDTIPPGPVAGFRVEASINGKILLRWNVPSGPHEFNYHLYRSQKEIKDTTGLIPFNTYMHIGQYEPFGDAFVCDTPGSDGIYYYAIYAIDEAGNIGQLTQAGGYGKEGATTTSGTVAIIPVNVDRIPPYSPINLKVTQLSGGILHLTWDKPDGEEPLYYKVYMSGAELSESNAVLTEVYGVPKHDGTYFFEISSLDKAQNESERSEKVSIDYQAYPPVARRIKISPKNAYKCDIFTPGWLRIGTYTVILETDKEMAGVPVLSYTPLKGTAISVPLKGEGTRFQGEIIVTSATNDGAAYWTFSGTDTCGIFSRYPGKIVEGEYFMIDHTPPGLPRNVELGTASYVTAGGIEIKWDESLGEMPRWYRVYRSTQPITNVIEMQPVNIQKLEKVLIPGKVWDFEKGTWTDGYIQRPLKHIYTDIPPGSGTYYYVVTAVDLAGNETQPSVNLVGTSAQEMPIATSILLYSAAGGINPITTVGVGTISVELRTAAPLDMQPDLFIQIEDTEAVRLYLSGQAGVWKGSFTISPDSATGTAKFIYHVTATNGLSSDAISYGRLFKVDTVPLTAEIIIPSIYKMQYSLEKKDIITPPIGAGDIVVELTTNKPLVDVPTLTYTPSGRESIPIVIQGWGTDWRGVIHITKTTGDGTATFSFKGKDRDGNESTIIAPVRYGKVTEYMDKDGTLVKEIHRNYATTDSKFVIDTTPPGKPLNLRAEMRKLGVAAIYWDEPAGEVPQTYNVYRAMLAVFNGEVEVYVHSPDLAGNEVRSSAGIAAKPLNNTTGGKVASADKKVEFKLPPLPKLSSELAAKLTALIPEGINIPETVDRDMLMFASYQNDYDEEGKEYTNVDKPVPDEMQLDLSKIQPGLVLVGKPYVININLPYIPPDIIQDRPDIAKGIRDLLTMPFPAMGGGEGGGGVSFVVAPPKDQYNDEKYMEKKLKIFKWLDPKYSTETTNEIIDPGKWVVVPESTYNGVTGMVSGPMDRITKYAVFAETVPPKITSWYPKEDTAVSDFRSTIKATIEDLGVGIKESESAKSIVLKIDGKEVKHEYDWSDPTIGYLTCTPAEDLAPGSHIVTLFVEDIVENKTTFSWKFIIDNTPPEIGRVIPQQGKILNMRKPVISAIISDIGGGVVPETVILTLNSKVVANTVRHDSCL